MPNVAASLLLRGTFEYAGLKGACCIVRGLRSEADFLYERDWAIINKGAGAGIETIFLITRRNLRPCRPSNVKECARLGYDLSAYVPDEILGDVLVKLGGQ
jgi:pantetheine-phosphate adenylyltransferase